jgi:hypothetical protein
VNAWKVIFATIVIFGAGVFSGGLLVNFVDHSRPGGIHHPPPPAVPHEPMDTAPRPEVLKTNFVQRLDEALQLTPEQKGEIEQIVQEGQERNRQLWQQIAPEVRGVAQDTRQHIKAVLTEEQKKQFEDMFRRARRMGPTNMPPAAPLGGSTNSPSP